MRRITCERSTGSWAAHTNTTPWKLAPLAARPALRSARRRRWPSRPSGYRWALVRLVRLVSSRELGPMQYSAVFIPRYRLFAASPFPGLYGILLGPFSDQTCAGLMK